jgi:hypothetical protein
LRIRAINPKKMFEDMVHMIPKMFKDRVICFLKMFENRVMIHDS